MRCLGKCGDKASNSCQQNALAPADPWKLIDITPQVDNPVLSDGHQLCDIALYVANAGVKLLADSGQPDLETDVGLDHIIMNIAGEPTTLLLGGAGRKLVD